MFIDTHAHLDFDQFGDELPEILKRALQVGVGKIITVGCNIASAKKALEITETYPNVYAAIGIHPCDILQDEDQTKQLLKLEQLLEKREKIVALGEIGLDYYWMTCPVELQKEMFKNQLKIAKAHSLAVIIHARNAKDGSQDAYKDCFQILQEMQIPKAVFHCFSGTLAFAEEVWKTGYFTSFTGIITYPKSDVLEGVVRKAPLNQIMIETDSPFLAPQVFRGKRNEPAYVVEVAKKISELKSVFAEDLEKQLEINTRKFFGI